MNGQHVYQVNTVGDSVSGDIVFLIYKHYVHLSTLTFDL